MNWSTLLSAFSIKRHVKTFKIIINPPPLPSLSLQEKEAAILVLYYKLEKVVTEEGGGRGKKALK